MKSRNVRRGRVALEARKAAADDRAANYKQPKTPVGMREQVRRGIMSREDALKAVTDSGIPASGEFLAWLKKQKTAPGPSKASKKKGKK